MPVMESTLLILTAISGDKNNFYFLLVFSEYLPVSVDVEDQQWLLGSRAILS